MRLHDINAHPELPRYWLQALSYLKHCRYTRFVAYYTRGGKLRFRAFYDPNLYTTVTNSDALYYATYREQPLSPDDPSIDWSKI